MMKKEDASRLKLLGKTNGLKYGLYYTPISHATLSLTPTAAGLDTLPTFTSDFFIKPTTSPMEGLAKEALTELARLIFRLNKAPDPKEFFDKYLEDLLEEYKGDGSEADLLKKKLVSAGHTGLIIQCTRKLDHAQLNPTNRLILSYESIYVYQLYRAIIGLKIEDVDGAVSNVMEELKYIKSYINADMVGRYIRANSLFATPSDVELLKTKVANFEFPYGLGQVTRVISSEYEKLRKGGNLITLVTAFLDSGQVRIPDHVDRNELINKMVIFLLDTGVVVDDKESMMYKMRLFGRNRSNDDLTVIEGIGDKTSKLLRKYKINTFRALALAPVTELNKILKEVNSPMNPASWPRQARLAAVNDMVGLKKLKAQLVAGKGKIEEA